MNLLHRTERLVRRIAAVVTLLGALGASGVAAAILGWPFPGLWYLFAPVAASVMAAIVLRGAGSSGQVWRAVAIFYLPALVVWFLVFALLMSRAGG